MLYPYDESLPPSANGLARDLAIVSEKARILSEEDKRRKALAREKELRRKSRMKNGAKEA